MTHLKLFPALRLALSLAFMGFLSFGAESFDSPTETKDSRTHSLNLFGQTEKPVPHPARNAFKVLLDPGHGGKDLGAQGFFSISEKTVALSMGKMVRRELEKLSKTHPSGTPIEIRLTRDTDNFLPLRERVAKANEWGADLFVSLHANSSQFPKVRGFEVYFLDAEASDEHASKVAHMENAGATVPVKNNVLSILSDAQTTNHVNESSHFAESVFSSMAVRAITQARSVRQGPFTVLHGTTMPAILIEVGYVTNVEDALNLSKDSYLKRLSNAISNGIFEYALRKPNESNRWTKNERASASQSNASLSQSPRRKLPN